MPAPKRVDIDDFYDFYAQLPERAVPHLTTLRGNARGSGQVTVLLTHAVERGRVR